MIIVKMKVIMIIIIIIIIIIVEKMNCVTDNIKHILISINIINKYDDTQNNNLLWKNGNTLKQLEVAIYAVFLIVQSVEKNAF